MKSCPKFQPLPYHTKPAVFLAKQRTKGSERYEDIPEIRESHVPSKNRLEKSPKRYCKIFRETVSALILIISLRFWTVQAMVGGGAERTTTAGGSPRTACWVTAPFSHGFPPAQHHSVQHPQLPITTHHGDHCRGRRTTDTISH